MFCYEITFKTEPMHELFFETVYSNYQTWHKPATLGSKKTKWQYKRWRTLFQWKLKIIWNYKENMFTEMLQTALKNNSLFTSVNWNKN